MGKHDPGTGSIGPRNLVAGTMSREIAVQCQWFVSKKCPVAGRFVSLPRARSSYIRAATCQLEEPA